MGVFARGWLGFVFTRGACSPFGVCVLWCVRSPGGGGTIIVPPLLPRLLACLLACVLTPWCGLVGVCGVLRARWAEGGLVGAGQSCPAPTAWRWAARWLRARGERRCVWGAPRGVLTRARTEGGRGEPSWGGPWWSGRGLWVVACWVVTRVGGDKCPKPGESKIDTTGAGAIVRSRPWCGFGSGCVGWLRLLVVALLPLGARGGAGGVALSPWWWVCFWW